MLVGRGDDPRARHLQADRLHRLAEEDAVLGAADRVDARADQLDPEPFEHPRLRQLDREVERRLAAQRRQQRVGPLALEHVGDAVEVERLEVGAVGEAGVGHDRGRVRVDDDRAEAVLAQHLQRLAARVVELAGLPDHDRPGADQADRLDVSPPRQGSSTQLSMIGQASCGPGPGLRVELHRVRAQLGEVEALDGAVVERDVRRLLGVARRDREAVVLDRHEHAAGLRARAPDGSRRGGRTAACTSRGRSRARAAGGRGRCRGSARARRARAAPRPPPRAARGRRGRSRAARRRSRRACRRRCRAGTTVTAAPAPASRRMIERFAP